MAKDKQKAKKKDKDEKKKKKKASNKTKDVKNKKDKSKSKSKRKNKLSPEERIEMIRTAAYYLAQNRGYDSGRELDDWIKAEKDIKKITK